MRVRNGEASTRHNDRGGVVSRRRLVGVLIIATAMALSTACGGTGAGRVGRPSEGVPVP